MNQCDKLGRAVSNTRNVRSKASLSAGSLPLVATMQRGLGCLVRQVCSAGGIRADSKVDSMVEWNLRCSVYYVRGMYDVFADGRRRQTMYVECEHVCVVYGE